MKRIFLIFLFLGFCCKANVDPIEVAIEKLDVRLFRYLLDSNSLLRVEDKQRYINQSEQQLLKEIEASKFKFDWNFCKSVSVGLISLYLAGRGLVKSRDYYNSYCEAKEYNSEHVGEERLKVLGVFTASTIFSYIGITRLYKIITLENQKKRVYKAAAIAGILNHIPVRANV